MRTRILVAALLVAGVAVAVIDVGLAPEHIVAVNRLIVLNAKLGATLGALIALAQFSPGDYLRRAWALLALGSACLVEADLFSFLVGPVLTPDAAGASRSVFVIFSNLFSPLAMLVFARALTAVGLDLVGHPRIRALVTCGAAAVALLIAGPTLVSSTRLLVAGDLSKISAFVSALGDTATIILVAPLVYNVMTLRGGTLSWPFVLLAMSTLSWVFYDGAVIIARSLGTADRVGIALEACARTWACLFLFGAGMAQRWVRAGVGHG
jgi:hypothetical protein